MLRLSQFLAILKMAILQKKLYIEVGFNKYLLNILWVLYKKGFISGYQIENTFIKIQLKYSAEYNMVGVIKQISLISRRIYIDKKLVSHKQNSAFLHIVTTSIGIQSIPKSKLKKNVKVGGELLLKIN